MNIFGASCIMLVVLDYYQIVAIDLPTLLAQ